MTVHPLACFSLVLLVAAVILEVWSLGLSAPCVEEETKPNTLFQYTLLREKLHGVAAIMGLCALVLAAHAFVWETKHALSGGKHNRLTTGS